MDKLMYNFTDEINSNFEKNCIRNILAKVTTAIVQMDVSELYEGEANMLETLSSTAIALVDEIKYLEKVESGLEQKECDDEEYED